MASCHTHGEQPAAGTCRSCRSEFCRECLVYSYGAAKPPYCIRCALIAAGTRPPEPAEQHTLSA